MTPDIALRAMPRILPIRGYPFLNLPCNSPDASASASPAIVKPKLPVTGGASLQNGLTANVRISTPVDGPHDVI